MNKGIATYSVLLVLLIVLTLCIHVFFNRYGQEYAPKFFILIPSFYLIDGLLLSILTGKQSEKGERVSVKKLMLLRLVRIIGSLIVLIAGIVLDRIHILTFVILFVIYYIVYLVFETIIMKNSQKPDEMKKEM